MKIRRRLLKLWKRSSRFRSPIREARIRLKWRRDRKHLPLTRAHRALYLTIHRWHWYKLGVFPDLVNCDDFNDRIQWLKLFDQDERMIACADKLRVKDYVAETIGAHHVPDTYQVVDSYEAIDFSALPDSFVIKTNHDSGTVVPVADKSNFSHAPARKKLNKSLNRCYGENKGEWAYAFVTPRLFVEQHLTPGFTAAPADYKFYCVAGCFRYCFLITDRHTKARERIIDRDGNDLFPDAATEASFARPDTWSEMIRLAEQLARPFKCVRVDMYSIDGRIYVGELTFWPQAGAYQGDNRDILGAMLDFDRSTFKTPISSVRTVPSEVEGESRTRQS